MNTISFRQKMTAALVLLAALMMSFQAVEMARGDEDQSKTLSTLKAGIDNYLREVEFKCTYTYSEYLVDSKEEAENFDTSNGRLFFRGTGSLIKSKTMTYESFELDRAATDHLYFDDIVFDHTTVTNSDLCATYTKQAANATHRTVWFGESKKTEGGIQLLNHAYGFFVCPLTFGGGRACLNCVDAVINFRKIHPDITTITVDHNKENSRISMRYDNPDAESVDKVITLSNQYVYPVAISEEKKIHKYAIDKNLYDTAGVFDLVEVGKGLVVPKKICSSQGPLYYHMLGKEALGKWIVRKWESEDLGAEAPKANDFLIPLDKDTDIGGLELDLAYKLNQNVPEYLDINSFSIADLYISPEESLVTVPQTEQRVIFRYHRPILILLGITIIAVGFYIKWSSRWGKNDD